MEKTSNSGFRFFDAIKAGFMATVVLTVVMWLMGINSMLGLGKMLMGPDATTASLYMAGGALHFGIGMFYGVVYALFLAPIGFMNGLFKALVFSVLITAASHYGMPKMPEIIANIKGDTAGEYNPCNPCAGYNPCNPCEVYNPCNPCNPCGGGDKKAMLMSWVNHLIFSLALASMYRRRVM